MVVTRLRTRRPFSLWEVRVCRFPLLTVTIGEFHRHSRYEPLPLFLPVFLLGFAWAGLMLSARAPNIIFVLADDLGYGDLLRKRSDPECRPNREGRDEVYRPLFREPGRFFALVLMTGKDPGHAFVRNNRGMPRSHPWQAGD